MLEEVFNVKGKNVLITGTTGWLGSHMKETLEGCGANVISMNRRDVVGGFSNTHGFRNHLLELASGIEFDVLINNAYNLSEETGFNTEDGTLEKSYWTMWYKAFDSGIYWPLMATQIIGNKMKEKGGSIINISSMYGVVSPHPDLYEGSHYFNPVTYSTVKHGLIGLTKYTAAFWGKHGIRCNAIAPGPFPKENVKQGSFLLRLERRTALNRVGHPNDLRGILIYLASDASAYTTGQVIQVDGGWTIT
jgi:gluconate 5-dehydrogenase